MMQRSVSWLVGAAFFSISTMSPAQQMAAPVCFQIAIAWANYSAPLLGSSVNEKEVATAKQQLLEVRPDMPSELQATLDDFIAANEALADNPKDMLDSDHPLNNGESERLMNAYEEQFEAACPEPSS
ncbi:hypothetical protein [Halomonas faecis]|uniref:hypothetical protein n=1 Tax=Halomonas faecis TaxID=1562110 RepID=UPI0013D24DAF|nr:hypothetical protein [Halomonas faecis]